MVGHKRMLCLLADAKYSHVILLWILAGGCALPKVSAVADEAFGENTAIPVPSEGIVQNQILSDIGAPVQSGILLLMFDGVAVDPDLGQPILSIFRLDGLGNLYQLYTPQALPPTGQDFDVSPDGQWLVFVETDPESGESDIYKMSTGGTNRLRMTNSAVEERAPRWSPDGTTIAFAVHEVGSTESRIARIDESGADLGTVVSIPSEIQDMQWSPGGEHLLLETVEFDSATHRIQVLSLERLSIEAISGGLSLARNAVWSPSGDRLAFTARTGDRDQGYLYELATGELSEVAGEGSLLRSSPRAWSRDGRYIVLSGSKPDSPMLASLWLWDAGEKRLQRLLGFVEYSADFLSWSPDSAKILVAVELNGPETSLLVVDKTGAEPYSITGIPYLTLGVRVLTWGNLAKLPDDSSPDVAGIRLTPAPIFGVADHVGLTSSTTVASITIRALETIKLRSGPSTDFPVVGEVRQGASLTAIGSSVDAVWLQVHFDGVEKGIAWVYAAFTDYEASNDPLPIVTLETPFP